MKWLLLIALVAYTSAVVVKHQVQRIESKRIQLIKSGLWEEHLRTKEVLRSFNKIVNKQIVHNDFLDVDDAEYVSNITIGTPAQQFVVILDTSTAIFWVADSTCTISLCSTRHLFQSSKSSSYVEDGRGWSAGYSDASSAWGFYGQDTVGLGGSSGEVLKVPHQLFGQAEAMRGFTIDNVDGIVGLAFPISGFDVIPPLVNAVQQGLLDQPIFTIHLRHNGFKEYVYGGRVTYGGLDTENCGDVVAYQPLSSATYWQFRIASVSGGGYSSVKSVDVISSTGRAQLGGPTSIVDSLARALGGQFDSSKNLYYIDCAAKPGPISIVIGSNTYNIDEVNYIEEIGDKVKCVLALTPQDMSGFAPQWVLGDPFIRSYCHVHDIGNQKIGFAKSKQV